VTLVKSRARNNKRNSNAKTTPARIERPMVSLENSIFLLVNLKKMIKKKNASKDLNPAKKTGFNPVLTTFITT
jgi:hypothetical protein|tara:strand:+ start:827 stop:1045 length:219 start_codon:yes stop_codon:yes gene_type:complete